MHHFFDWTFHWIGDHPYQTGFYILAIVVSIYGANIKAFLSIPPQKLKIWIFKARRATAQSRLDELEKIHNNSYQFLLRFAQHCTFILISAFAMVTIYAVSRGKPNRPLPVQAPEIILGIGIFLEINRFSSFLTRLSAYEKTKAKLGKRLADLNVKLT